MCKNTIVPFVFVGISLFGWVLVSDCGLNQQNLAEVSKIQSKMPLVTAPFISVALLFHEPTRKGKQVFFSMESKGLCL